jgi:hypothetical protein
MADRQRSRDGDESDRGGHGRFPLARPPAHQGPLARFAHSPLVRLAAYYLLLALIGVLLVRYVPLARNALVTPVIPALGEGAALLGGEGAPATWANTPALAEATIQRAITTLFVVLGAIAIALPVAWTYLLTKWPRVDAGLVRTVVILPIAVAGILLVVKNSLAVAFSLAGIVAAVRFRNTLKDPRDAVFVFMAIGIGIAAGVQAVDVAMMVSVVFNLAVIALWRFQIGSIYGGRYSRTGVLSIGDRSLLVAQTPEACRSIRRDLVGRVDGLKSDGILLVHSTDPELSRQTVQDALSQIAKDWQLLGMFPRGPDVTTAEYVVRMAKDEAPADLLGAIEEWSTHVAAAEFIPFRHRRHPREAGGEIVSDAVENGPEG